MKIPHLLSIATTLGGLAFLSSLPAQSKEIYQKGFLSKEEARKSIEVPEGYELELVLSDPIIKEPVTLAWDGNGVMYVVEMRTYMQDADASGEKDPTSRISRHEDTDGDGVYDKHSVYIDDLLLPRMILPLDDRLMVGITNTLDLWNYRDSDGDGVADEKVKIYEGGKRGGNMEHQPSGLLWAMDNWIYVTYESVRYRFTDGKLVKENIPQGNGQWGLTQDDDGRLYYSRAGGESPAETFQQQPQYGMINTRGQLAKDFKKVYPIAPVPDVQGGEKRIGSSGGLNYFTGCAGQEIFRGNALPEDLYGDLFIPEPVGRLIRRAKVDRSEGLTTLSNAHPESEFIRSRDINFRPLQMSTGPDGCLYIVDMHRGIIQQGNWTRPGSYLRGIIDKWGLAKNTNKGRIYRLVHKDHKPGPKPQLNSLKTKELLQYLGHSNGWWRDTAKRLILLREDRESTAPALEKVALNSTVETQTRLTALWTLEGMSAARPDLLVKLLADSNTRIVTNAIRVSETWIKRNDASVIAALEKLSTTSDTEIALQMINSIQYAGNPVSLEAAHTRLMDTQDRHPVVVANVERRNKLPKPKKGKNTNTQLATALQSGQKIYAQLCIECHGDSGKGTPMAGQPGVTLAPALTSSRVNGPGESLIRILLHGMQGPIDGKTYSAGIMPPQATNDDKWISDVATYIRNDFGNSNSMITPEMIKSIRKNNSTRTAMWTQKELEELEPRELLNQKRWKMTASHGQSTIQNAIDRRDGSRYTSGKTMEPGMWVQIELPSAVTIQRVVMNAKQSINDFPSEYSISLSMNGRDWETGDTQKGTPSISTSFTPDTKARYIRINQEGQSRSYFWSIHELYLFGN